MVSDVQIKHDEHGYYNLTVNGEFAGNFDTFLEAADEAEAILEEHYILATGETDEYMAKAIPDVRDCADRNRSLRSV